MRKLVLFLALVIASPIVVNDPVRAETANCPFDQHFRVQNRAGERIFVKITRGDSDDRSKTIPDGDGKTFKFLDLKEVVHIFNCDAKKDVCNVQFTRTFTFEIGRPDQARYPSCDVRMRYTTNEKRTSVNSREVDWNDCGSSVSFDSEDGKTLKVRISGFSI